MTLRVIGIDPGSRVTGYGIVDQEGNRLVYVHSGSIKAAKQAEDFCERLEIIHDELHEVITTYEPDVASIEGIFYHRNAKSALKLGHARGVAVLTARLCRLEIFEYAPAKIKQSVVGHGQADKEQISKMVCMLLGISEPDDYDTSDALANAICHIHKQSLSNMRVKR